MRRRLSIAMVVCLGICVAPLVVNLAGQEKAAQEKKEGKDVAKLERVEGNAHLVAKAPKTVPGPLRGKGSTRDVVYSDSTKFSFRNKPATMDEVKDGRHVIC